MKKILLLFITAMLIVSCGSQKLQDNLSSWMGSHKSALIQSWGAPTKIMSDGNGGEILIFQRQIGINQYASIRIIEMSADANGKLYLWRWKTRRIPQQNIYVY